MIKQLKLVITQSTNPFKNLALEEYLLEHVGKEECILYLWQNQKTVVIGRNQNAWKECRCENIKEDGGFVARRLSGGGAVYHDLGNLNFTFLIRKEDYDVGRQTNILLQCFKNLGLKAEKTGRNDVVIEGKKVSGHAYYETQAGCYHHGTIMVDVEKEKLQCYLNVNQKKLKSNSVASVSSRVANLTDFDNTITKKRVQQSITESFEKEYDLPVQEILSAALMNPEIKALEEKYASWDWVFGKKETFENYVEHKFIWGLFEMGYNICNGRFSQVEVFSDSLYPEFIEYLKEAFISAKEDEMQEEKHKNQTKAGSGRTYTKDTVRKVMKDAKAYFPEEGCRQMIFDIEEFLLSQIL